jgi:glutamate-1-semialdehyde 2,1-aminomutase
MYDWLEVLGSRLESGLNDALQSTGVEGTVQRVGAMLTLFFSKGPVENYVDAAAANHELFGAWHRGLVERKIYWPPSGYEAAFLSAAHSEEDIDATVTAARESLAAL